MKVNNIVNNFFIYQSDECNCETVCFIVCQICFFFVHINDKLYTSTMLHTMLTLPAHAVQFIDLVCEVFQFSLLIHLCSIAFSLFIGMSCKIIMSVCVIISKIICNDICLYVSMFIYFRSTHIHTYFALWKLLKLQN